MGPIIQDPVTAVWLASAVWFGGGAVAGGIGTVTEVVPEGHKKMYVVAAAIVIGCLLLCDIASSLLLVGHGTLPASIAAPAVMSGNLVGWLIACWLIK